MEFAGIGSTKYTARRDRHCTNLMDKLRTDFQNSVLGDPAIWQAAEKAEDPNKGMDRVVSNEEQKAVEGISIRVAEWNKTHTYKK